MNNRIFLAAPISGFANEYEYKNYRINVMKLISFLRENGYEVFSEIECISGSKAYDSPATSIEKDFKDIASSDYFLFLHPMRIQSSSLIEYGYVCALNKKIVSVGRRRDFPYLIIGYEEFSDKSIIVETENISEEYYLQILMALKSL